MGRVLTGIWEEGRVLTGIWEEGRKYPNIDKATGEGSWGGGGKKGFLKDRIQDMVDGAKNLKK